MSQYWELREEAWGRSLVFLCDWDLDATNEFMGYMQTGFDPAAQTRLTVDLRALIQVDSMVIGILVNLSKQMRKHGGVVNLLQPPHLLEKLLSDVGLQRYFNIVHSEAELTATPPGAPGN